MKITLGQLRTGKPVERVVIHSIDCSLYIARAIVGGEEHLITDDAGATLKTRNLLDMKQHLSGIPIGELFLQQQSAYDEMVGQPGPAGSNRMEVPLETFPSWLN